MLTTTNDVVLGTVPAGKVWLLKDMRVVTGQQVGAGQGAHLLVGIGTTNQADMVARLIVPYLSTWVDPSPDPLVMHAGEVLKARHSGASGMSEATLVISGVELAA